MVTLSLCCRYLVIDPCNRTPSHLPQSDRWLDTQNDKLTQIVCDWLSDLAWDGWRVDAGASPFDSTAFDVRDLLELRPERGKRDGQGFRVSWFSVERTDSGKMTIPIIVATLFATGRNPPMKIHYLLTWRFVS